MDNYDNSTAQVQAMSPEEAKAFLRELLDTAAMRSSEVNQQVRKMLRGQRDQVAWFGRMEPGADAESMPTLVDAKPKKPINAIVKKKKKKPIRRRRRCAASVTGPRGRMPRSTKDAAGSVHPP